VFAPEKSDKSLTKSGRESDKSLTFSRAEKYSRIGARRRGPSYPPQTVHAIAAARAVAVPRTQALAPSLIAPREIRDDRATLDGISARTARRIVPRAALVALLARIRDARAGRLERRAAPA